MDESSRDFLERAIKDYNNVFSTNYYTSADKFPNYYKDVSLRMKNREIDILIVKSIESSTDLRDKKELIERFINSMTANGDVYEEWQTYLNEQKKAEYAEIIDEENLKSDKAMEFIEMAFTRGYVPEGGLELNNIMPPINPFDPNANRQGKVEHVLERLKTFFTKYYGFADGKFSD